jgi:spermidine/putrescine transport system substrate-binding protein
VLLAVAILLTSGDEANSNANVVAPPPADLDAPATGTLRIFSYGDTVPDRMMDPFREQNPDLDVKIATFNSNKAAAAKLAGGFDADVVEVCTDEMEPLIKRSLLRPLDETAITDFDKLAFSDSEYIRNDAGEVLFVPGSSGPHGIIVNTDEVTEPIDSYTQLFDPAYAGRAALEASPLSALGVAALALGYDDPFDLNASELDAAQQYLLDHRDNFRSFAESDSDLINLFKSGEVVIADGGRGTAQDMIDDGLPVEWIPPKEGATSWVCGFAITSNSQNIPAAYRLINYYSSPQAQAISAQNGFVAMNPKSLELIPPALRKTADPANLDAAVPATEPRLSELYDRAWQEVAVG